MKQLLLSLVFFLLPVMHCFAIETGVITGNNVRMRSEANTKASIYDEFFKGNLVQIFGTVSGEKVGGSDKWYKVSYYTLAEERGYIHASFVATGKEKEAFLKKFNRKEFDGELKKMFSPAQIAKITEFDNKYNSIKSARDLEAAFRLAAAGMNDWSEALDKVYQAKIQDKSINEHQYRFNWLFNYLPGLYGTYVAEGTMLHLTFMLGQWKQKARQTPEAADDDFIKLRLDLYGNIEYHTASWFEMKWDYGGDSLLGNGIHYKYLKEIDRQLAQSKLFDKELIEEQNKMVQDIQSSTNYSETREKIIAEIKKILSDIKLSTEQRNILQQRLKDFENPKKQINTNCKESGSQCTYG